MYRPVALGIYALFFLIGVIYALIIPTLSLFLAKEIGVRPLLVAVPFAGVALASIFYNHFIGNWSDKLADRRPLIGIFSSLGCVVCLVLAYSRGYWVIALTIMCFLSLAMVAYSQVLAYSLDYANRNVPVERRTLFNSIVRAQIAMAWVAGPPAGFIVVNYMGFQFLYLLVMAMFALVALLGMKLLPNLQSSPHQINDHNTFDIQPLTAQQKRALLLCVIGFSCMWSANNVYLISLPLYLKDDLKLGTDWVGWIMGTCALLEVPCMLLAGHYAARINIMSLIKLGGISALVLYAGVYVATDLWQFFVLQIFNAIFIGILAGLGVSLVQQVLPGRSGAASALYTNTTHMGGLLSSLVVAVVADRYGYHQVFIVSVGLIAAAILAFSAMRNAHPDKS
ncbi:MAG: MFS transporter [Moraxellaceae bacterium]|nr:MAG: MFS transporter [Moraxellaceae bacterium]